MGKSVVELLRTRAEEQPLDPAYTFLLDGELDEVTLTFAEVDRAARAIAVALRDAGARGERALLLFPPGLDFITAFFGCLYAGVVAVPAYPPMQARHVGRVKAIVGDCSPRVVMTTSMVRGIVEPMLGDANVAWMAVDEVDAALAERWQDPEVTADTLTFLQYTSGSTGLPKGVMVTHANLLDNEELIHLGTGTDSQSTFVGWLPLYHDMGLIGNVLHPLYMGSRCVLMSPLSFLERPLRWLRAIDRFRAHTSGGPNFAYDLCSRKVTPAELATLDLRSWKIAFNGAEPVRRETMDRFSDVFATCGFRRESFYPCYGLAEATLFVSGGDKDGPSSTVLARPDALKAGILARASAEAIADGEARALVSSGTVRRDQDVVIVHAESSTLCAPTEIGEIWVRGPSVSMGYWNHPEKTAHTFEASLAERPDGQPRGPFLRTGDLGIFVDGELYVTGRLKDLIIVRGRNHYPQDLEQTAESCHPEVRRGCSAAFSIDGDANANADDGSERLVMAVEISTPSLAEEVSAAVRRAIAEAHDLHVATVVTLTPRSIPKTSSGKIQRHACREGFLANELSEFARSSSAPEAVLGALSHDEKRDVLSSAPSARRAWIENVIAREIGRILRIAPEALDRSVPLADLGLDSMMALGAADRLETLLGVRLSAATLWSHPTVTAASDYVLTLWLASYVTVTASATATADVPGVAAAPALGARDQEVFDV